MEATGLNLQTISVIVGIFIGLGTLIAGCGFAYAQFKTGGDKAKDDLIDTLKETAVVERDKAARLAAERVTLVDSHQVQINQLNERIGKLQGLYEASEQSKKEYLEILQGRDPAQKAFMELLTKAAENNNKDRVEAQQYMKDTVAVLGEIRTFMENLNKSAKKSNNFQDEVNSATAKESGKVLRKEV